MGASILKRILCGDVVEGRQVMLLRPSSPAVRACDTAEAAAAAPVRTTLCSSMRQCSPTLQTAGWSWRIAATKPTLRTRGLFSKHFTVATRPLNLRLPPKSLHAPSSTECCTDARLIDPLIDDLSYHTPQNIFSWEPGHPTRGA